MSMYNKLAAKLVLKKELITPFQKKLILAYKDARQNMIMTDTGEMEVFEAFVSEYKASILLYQSMLDIELYRFEQIFNGQNDIGWAAEYDNVERVVEKDGIITINIMSCANYLTSNAIRLLNEIFHNAYASQERQCIAYFGYECEYVMREYIADSNIPGMIRPLDSTTAPNAIQDKIIAMDMETLTEFEEFPFVEGLLGDSEQYNSFGFKL